MPAPLHHIVYQSTARLPLPDGELARVLQQSRAWNVAHGLTGVLLFSHGTIVQVLEGSEDEVRHIFARIARDPRHTGVVKLSDGGIRRRHFAQWSMGFHAVDPTAFAGLAGFLRPGGGLPTGAAPDEGLAALLAGFVTDQAMGL